VNWIKGEGVEFLGEGDEVEFDISKAKRLPSQQCRVSLLKKCAFALTSVKALELLSIISDKEEEHEYLCWESIPCCVNGGSSSGL